LPFTPPSRLPGASTSPLSFRKRHKTLAITLRYAHLSPGHQLDAVRRLDEAATGTATGSEDNDEKVAASGGAEVVELPEESSGGARSRTADVGIMRIRVAN
jgi:hypothetical protein